VVDAEVVDVDELTYDHEASEATNVPGLGVVGIANARDAGAVRRTAEHEIGR
jgi:hypothetical protein